MAKQKEPRFCSGVVPLWRDSAGILHTVMVKSNSSNRWTFPKGGMEEGLTPEQNAAKEAYEEAGIIGHITNALGILSEQGRKPQHTMYFAMQVSLIAEGYPEEEIRKRRVFAVEDMLSHNKIAEKYKSLMRVVLRSN